LSEPALRVVVVLVKAHHALNPPNLGAIVLLGEEGGSHHLRGLRGQLKDGLVGWIIHLDVNLFDQAQRVLAVWWRNLIIN
jgi:hypothetical protein